MSDRCVYVYLLYDAVHFGIGVFLWAGFLLMLLLCFIGCFDVTRSFVRCCSGANTNDVVTCCIVACCGASYFMLYCLVFHVTLLESHGDGRFDPVMGDASNVAWIKN